VCVAALAEVVLPALAHMGGAQGKAPRVLCAQQEPKAAGGCALPAPAADGSSLL